MDEVLDTKIKEPINSHQSKKDNDESQILIRRR